MKNRYEYGKSKNYFSIHNWINNNFGKPKKCEECLNEKLSQRQYHWANISGKYKRIRKDWRRLCVRCHSAFDRKIKIKKMPTQEINRREKTRITQGNFQRKLKDEALTHYGNQCRKCGEKDKKVLIISGGEKYRKDIKYQICYWLKRNNYPKEFFILCWNCRVRYEKNSGLYRIK